MKELCRIILEYALRKNATDIHLEAKEDSLDILLRTPQGLIKLDQDIIHLDFLEYLKFISGMDLCLPYKPQSGEFSYQLHQGQMDCRFSMMTTDQVKTGVIRLLHSSHHFALNDLSSASLAITKLKAMSNIEHGLVISCGPTGSGKSTTVHALLNEILNHQNRKIVTLEDPIEIQESKMIQIQVNDARGITYENGIEELMRHDPDILFFGECRTSYAAKMALRASLTGHLVFTTLHCGTGKECLYRLLDLGVDREELRCVLKGIFVCRLENVGNRKEGVYEIWNEQDIERLFANPLQANPGLSFETCRAQAGLSDYD
ncbi:ATPase, T2SS/T4P/T4SS family [Allobaculum stercoricanis]|uniref:ATPase, T2SS/T4P/T4SS family n=1 Tax=Allobaculum stercoricanis TaxID=174709 RepID=UPI002941CCFC|nr:ATPase, T2SS/T4P/T4SS family [Allobaculum stercoricanis]